MKAQLVRRDAALRYLGRWLIVGPLVVLTMMGVIASIRFRQGPGAVATAVDVALIVLTLWLPSAVYVAVSVSERRCSRFDMGLPISSRDVWLGHTVAMAAAGMAVLAFTAVVISAIGWTAGRVPGLFPQVFPTGTLGLALRVASVVLFATVSAQSILPALERLPRGGKLTWSILGAVILLGGCVVALGFLPLAVSALPVVLAVVVGRRTLRTLPGTMVIAGLAPTWFAGRRVPAAVVAPPGDAAVWAERSPVRGPVRRAWTLALTVYRSTTKMPLAPILGAPLLVAAGYTMAGAFGEVIRGDDAIRFSMLFIISYMLLSFSGIPPRRLFRLDALPISRRLVFGVSFLPLVALVALGYGGGRIVADRAENSREIICYCELDGDYYLSLPLRNGAIALNGRPPMATSPWGETHELWSRRILASAPSVIHSRFSAPPGSSREFVALQISRAVKAVYGEDLPPEAISERYLTVDAGGRVLPSATGLTLKGDHPEWRVRPHGPVFPVMMLVVCGLWLVAMSLYLRTLREGYTEKQKKGAFWWGMLVLMGLHVSQFIALFTEVTSHWLLSGSGMVAIAALADRVPGGSVTVWVVCGAVLVWLYRVTERRFLEVESNPGDDMRVELIQRPIGASVEDGAYAR